ncbi:MAG: lysine--tRNA ligase, partial [Candidatus Micrarchaeaceae archaeon]
ISGVTMADDFRLKKLQSLKALGIDPYPYAYNQTSHSSDIKERFAEYDGKRASVAGRILSMRNIGGVRFLDLYDSSGKIQIMSRSDFLNEQSRKIIELIDNGDIIGVTGIVTKTKRGEISIDAQEITVLSKSLLTLPEKFHGLTDTEVRYRKRHLDFIANPETKNLFVIRAKILKHVRDFLDARGYIEFETPVLQPTYGGANAKPFVTHYNALDTDVYLRVADELYLKRLIIGGFEKVYEVSKDFRNEDIDSTHNPEFTQVEFYEAYKDYNDFMTLTEQMLNGMVKSIFGSEKIEYKGKELSFAIPFKRLYWVDELRKMSGIDVSTLTDKEAIEIAARENLQIPTKNAYHVADALFDKYVQPGLFAPTFVVDFPAYMCPLTKDKRGNRLLSERFELYIAGKEVANCYSELTDPIEQRKKFEEQEEERRRGDEEAPPSDYDFIEAIEYGMPPTAGIGVSIDRIAMILTGSDSIKEVIAFPAVKPIPKAQAKKHAEKAGK